MMLVTLVIHLFPEILVVGDQNAIFLESPADDLLIGSPTKLVKGGEDVMILSLEPVGDRWPRAFIDQEAHWSKISGGVSEVLGGKK